jgi:hypothetical protein
VPLASCANSVVVLVKCEKPQSKQIKIFGNAKTPGLLRFLGKGKWTFISEVNSA